MKSVLRLPSLATNDRHFSATAFTGRHSPFSTKTIIALTSVCWGIFLVYSTLYCLLYRQHIDGAPRCVQGSLEWVTTEYGLWLLFAPLQILGLQHFFKRSWLSCVLFCAVLALVVNYLRVTIDVLLKPDAIWLSSWVYFWPTQLAAVAYTALGWALLTLVAIKSPPASEAVDETLDDSSSVAISPRRLTVQTGTQECEIAIDDIEYVMAAGNYMEVVTAERTYLLRATLKELQERLAPEGFVRSHRSYLVNRDMIDRRTAEALILQSGKHVPLSTRYGKFLQ